MWDFWSPFVNQGPHHLGKRIHRATRYSQEAVQPLLDSRQDQVIAEVDRDGRRVTSYPELIGSTSPDVEAYLPLIFT